MVCFYRNGANSQRGQKPNKPADWKEKDFLHGYDRCTKEFKVCADKVICEKISSTDIRDALRSSACVQ